MCSLDAFAHGEQGARALGELLVAFAEREDVSDHQEWEFVEGAGALLALLLAKHISVGRIVSRKGVCRLHLGKHGWFDPFAAIEQSLQAQDVQKAFARQLALAEAEGAGKGAVARVLAEFSSQLNQAFPTLAIGDVFECDVVLSNGVEVGLQRVVEATRSAGMTEVRKAVQKIVSLLGENVGEKEALPWQEAQGQIFPRLVSRDFLQELDASLNEQSCLYRRELGGDVCVTMILRYANRVKYLSTNALERWDVTEDEAYEIAIANLALNSAYAKFSRIDTLHGPLIMAHSGDGLDATRLLLPSLYNVLSNELGAECVVGVPHRDTLLACASAPSELIRELQMRVEDAARRAPHRISTHLWRLDSQGPPCLVNNAVS